MKKYSAIFFVFSIIFLFTGCSATKYSPIFNKEFLGIPLEFLLILVLLAICWLYFKNRNVDKKDIDEFHYLENHSEIHNEREEEFEEKIQEEELVAVIMAAISAASGLSEDEFVVRTIKRRNTKWQKVK